ncbi:hypothetical protein PoB_001941400 [Plakobranchus ocellatus]|uniref:Uncharacterized protein n=1 Tax=Plakobranchus ocellatus TaxID=259542 RepID=A0AAV3ZBY9_9GAST|nr:hypothetical protein PoB_001941400 [Plakobranchus ocellatus]
MPYAKNNQDSTPDSPTFDQAWYSLYFTSLLDPLSFVKPISHPYAMGPSKEGGVGGTVVSESALRSAGTLLLRVQGPLPAPWPDGGPKSLRSPCFGLAIYSQTFRSSTGESIDGGFNSNELAIEASLPILRLIL